MQREHVDVGYHLTAFYGTDYRYTTDKGYLSFQLLKDHHQYGFDPILEYIDIYVPKVASGMNIRIGRFISIPGIEAQLTPNNYMFSHSLLYSIDPFTDTGFSPRCRSTTSGYYRPASPAATMWHCGQAMPNHRQRLASVTLRPR